MKRIGILFLSAVSAGFFFLPEGVHACCSERAARIAAAEDAAGNAATGSVCTLRVQGMTCGACAASVADAAKSVPGVLGADVDLKAGTAVVRYQPQVTHPEAIAQAVTKAGFPASVSAR